MPVTGNATGNPLVPKEIEVIEAYLSNPRAGKSKAFVRVFKASKTDKATNNRASQFFKRGDVQAYMERRRKEVQASAGVNFEYLVAQQKAVLERCMSIRPVLDNAGKKTGKFEFNASGANRAIETLGKLTGAFEQDNKQKGEAAADAFGELMKEIAGGSHKPGDF